MNTMTMTPMGDGRLACVIKSPKGRILLQGFIYNETDVNRLKPMFTHYFGLKRGNEIATEAKEKLNHE